VARVDEAVMEAGKRRRQGEGRRLDCTEHLHDANLES
jgi:hypothetical protein